MSEIPSAQQADAPAHVAPCFHIPFLQPEAPRFGVEVSFHDFAIPPALANEINHRCEPAL